jgi:two-component system cell cycle sensor histidine kinase/response regulator CckA
MDKMLGRLFGADIDLRPVPTADLGHVKADPGQVEQVLMNLVVNARDAMLGGGKLTIETANVTLDGTVVGMRGEPCSGRYVMLAVSDNGTGMDAETTARIFEPFFTTKEIGHGTGLGLSTVHGIVEQSGGHIEVHSEIGHGTTFKVYFPRVDEPLEKSRPNQAQAKHGQGIGTILVIEDDDLVRSLTVRVLEGIGYTVVATENRSEALRACEAKQREGRSFDLVLSDVVMPGIALTELSEYLRATSPRARILYMSGYTDRAILHQEHVAGEVFLQKPFTIDELLSRVRRLLDEPPAAAA